MGVGKESKGIVIKNPQLVFDWRKRVAGVRVDGRCSLGGLWKRRERGVGQEESLYIGMEPSINDR